MNERIAYQFNGDHVLKFAGMEKLTGEQVTDELNRLHTIIAEQNEEIAALERENAELERVREALEEEEHSHAKTIDDRDSYHEQADALAMAISELTGVDIGEHSSANNPWAEALVAIDEYKAALASPESEQAEHGGLTHD